MSAEDSDWDRAFFTRLVAGLGTLPLIVACGPLMFVPSTDDGSKEALICCFALGAGVPLALALYLGRLRARNLDAGAKRWRMGSFETTIVGFELFFSVCLILGGAYPAFHYFVH